MSFYTLIFLLLTQYFFSDVSISSLENPYRAIAYKKKISHLFQPVVGAYFLF